MEVEVPKPKGWKRDRWQQTLLPWASARLAPVVVPVSITDLDMVWDTCTTTQLEPQLTVPGDGNPQNQKPLMLNITTISFPIGTKRKKAHDSKPVGRPHRAIFEWIRAIQATNSSVTKQGNGGSKRGPYLQWQAFHRRLALQMRDQMVAKLPHPDAFKPMELYKDLIKLPCFERLKITTMATWLKNGIAETKQHKGVKLVSDQLYADIQAKIEQIVKANGPVRICIVEFVSISGTGIQCTCTCIKYYSHVYVCTCMHTRKCLCIVYARFLCHQYVSIPLQITIEGLKPTIRNVIVEKGLGSVLLENGGGFRVSTG